MFINSFKWWDKRNKSPEEGIFDVIKGLQDSTDERNARFTRWLSLYHNAVVENFMEGGYYTIRNSWRSNNPEEMRNALNPIKSSISALAARIAAVKINPKILTNTDSPEKWHLRQQAKMLQQFIIGEFRRGGVYQSAENVFTDAGIMGLGAYKVYICDGKVKYERVFPGELVVDESSCVTSGETRSLYQVKYIPAEVLKARFPKYKNKIEDAVGQVNKIDPDSGTKTQTDLVEVAEAWHLKSSKDSKDGKHVICLSECTLIDEPYELDRFPFAFFRWSPVVLGWWPQGLAEDGEVLQQELNKLMKRIQDAHQLYSVAQTFVPKGSKVNLNHLSNMPGAVIEYSGNVKPQTTMPSAVSSEVYNWVDTLQNYMVQGFGLNQLAMSGMKPPGIESGAAIRELQDSQSGRFAQLSANWEQTFVDLAEITIELASQLDSQEGGYTTRLVEKDGIKDIKWSEIDLERQAYEIQVWPASMLPQTPAGKIQTVQDLMAGQFMDKKTALSMLDIPDLDSFISLENAAYDDAQKQIETMLVDGEQVHPEPYQDLQLCLEMTTSALLRAKLDGAPEERLELLQDYIDEIQDLLAPPEPPAAPAAPAGPEMGPEMPLPEGAPVAGPPIAPEGMPPLPPEMPVGAPPEALPQ